MDMLIGKMMADQLRKAQKIPELMSLPREAPAEDGGGHLPRPSLAERVAEDIRRDLEKLEQKRTEKEAREKGDE
jgi:hypothetical protein